MEFSGKYELPAEESAFGIWKDHPEDAVRCQLTLREEWEDDH